ncbi:outer membrane protein assembly complex, YaeT protein [gamma proteobacterium HTCC5015]|nr:outer membrane protein assembly complex, YaeT protein [gamma proteobacterium HTCC5015]
MLALPVQAFQVSGIAIEGNERLKPDTVLGYIDVETGDELGREQQAQVLRDLYDSALFTDVQLLREGNQLVIRVQERPAIAEIEFDGNHLIKTKDIETALEEVGMVKGRIYDKSVMDKLKLELERIYYSQGKYGVKLDAEVTELEDNRVAINIEIAEGFPARVTFINITGNKVFDDETLKDELKTGQPAWWAIFSDRDKYSKPKLQGDLETLRSWYLDRGYMKFSVDSEQVSISADKKDLYININVTEGDLYRVSDVRLAGQLVVEAEELEKLVLIEDGEPFSRKKIQQVTTLIKQRLGREGYARVKVNVIPEIDEASKEVVLDFNIDPGKRYLVRNIVFEGNHDTQDEVLRREMRQMENAWYDSGKIERGRVRVQRLSYISDITADLRDVPGTNDEVDLVYGVEERMSGSINLGAGYAQNDGVLFNFGVTKDNLFGTGNSLSFQVDHSSVTQSASASYTDPYYTIDGVSRSWSAYYRQTDSGVTTSSDYILNVLGVGLSYGIPMSEYSNLRLGVNVDQAELFCTVGSPQEVEDFLTSDVDKCVNADATKFNKFGDEYNTVTPAIGYVYDSRNRTIFAEKGIRQSLNLEISLPGSDLEFYKSEYAAEYYAPVTDRTVLLLKHKISYGSGYGDDLDTLPPYEKYTAGGIRSVRGYRSRSLTSDAGTIDSLDNAYGGDFRVAGGVEYVLPPPTDNNNLRFSVFYDFGNVYSVPEEFDAKALRTSAGVAMNWLTPIGALVFSYAEPLEHEPRDRTQRFQFTIGGSF